MKLFSSNKNYKLYFGNSLDMKEVIEPNSIDAVITDPPYELNFMGKSWDKSGIAFNKEIWQKCFEVLKPGAYLLAFGGTRTFHRIACAIEDAGFEIRDTIMWLYGSGFPKSLNIGLAIDKKMGVDNRTGKKIKGENMLGILNDDSWEPHDFEERIAQNKWAGWGTTLKPAYEPIIVARKPIENSVVENVLKYDVGGINIDACRVYGEIITSHDTEKGTFAGRTKTMPKFKGRNKLSFGQYDEKADRIQYTQHEGRYPSNVILTYDETDFDEVCGNMPYTKSEGGNAYNKENGDNSMFGMKQTKDDICLHDEGSACRYFYCAKASKRDRDDGLYDFEEISPMIQTGRKEHSLGLEYIDEEGKLHQNPYAGTKSYKKNIHPTVKPTELMQYLIKLVSPKGATILDPFNGSGSTGKAVMCENVDNEANYKYIGIELTEEYLPISKARIEFPYKKETKQIVVDGKKATVLSIFDFIPNSTE